MTKKQIQGLVATLLTIALIVTIFVSQNVVKNNIMDNYAMTDEEWDIYRSREDKDVMKANTPSKETDNIITSKDQLEDKPYLFIMYRIHCYVCENSHETMSKKIKNILQSYPGLEPYIAFVPTESTFGQTLVNEIDAKTVYYAVLYEGNTFDGKQYASVTPEEDDTTTVSVETHVIDHYADRLISAHEQ